MPTYRYRRATDGSEFELVQKITEPALTECPTTGSPVERVIQASNFVLKGSGWYKTDYATSSSGSSRSSSSSTKSESAPVASEPASCGTCGKAEGSCASSTTTAN